MRFEGPCEGSLWVSRVEFVMSALGSVYPQQQTSPDPVGTSHLGQNRTSALHAISCRHARSSNPASLLLEERSRISLGVVVIKSDECKRISKHNRRDHISRTASRRPSPRQGLPRALRQCRVPLPVVLTEASRRSGFGRDDGEAITAKGRQQRLWRAVGGVRWRQPGVAPCVFT
jgi:hypothetical protein